MICIIFYNFHISFLIYAINRIIILSFFYNFYFHLFDLFFQIKNMYEKGKLLYIN